MAEQNTPDGDATVVDLRILTRGVTAEQAAAVTAVLVAAVAEDAAALAMVEEPVRSEWASPRHALRRPVEVGRGRWAHFDS